MSSAKRTVATRVAALALVLPLGAPSVALAQGTQADAGAPAEGAAPAPTSGAEEKDVPPEKKAPMAGYAYRDKPAGGKTTKASRPRAKARAASGPSATFPGFEALPDGGSRLFLSLSDKVTVEEQASAGTLTYVLKGAHVSVRNDTNSLVTVHFNTPVTRAKLVPRGHDLLFVVELRAAVKPTWKVVEGPDKQNVLTIDFPKGDYLGASTEASDATAAPAAKESPKDGRPAGGAKKSQAPH